MNHDWTYCDGTGSVGKSSRRSILRGGLAALGLVGVSPALANILVDKEIEPNHVLVTVFLRGGADGLNIVAPTFEAEYYRQRPTLALKPSEAIGLDERFGLHPAMRPISDAWESGRMGIVHAVGSQDQTRSHFEAMSAMERGVEEPGAGLSSGWLARTLQQIPAKGRSPLRAVAIGTIMPDSLRGGPVSTTVESLADYRLNAEPALVRELASRYRKGTDEVASAGRETLAVLDTLAKLDFKGSKPLGGATYPNSDFGAAMRQVAMLIRAGVGLEFACVDKGGWDTHVVQGTTTGWQASLLDDVAKGLAAFQRDLGEQRKRVTVVVLTEFGRRVGENAGLGTDHGRGSVMFVLDDRVQGRKVAGEWPGLSPEHLEDGDLRVTTDYRTVLAEVLERRMGLAQSATVFPNLQRTRLGLLKA